MCNESALMEGEIGFQLKAAELVTRTLGNVYCLRGLVERFQRPIEATSTLCNIPIRSFSNQRKGVHE